MNRTGKWTLGALGAAALLITALTGGTALAQNTNTATTSPLTPPSQKLPPQPGSFGVDQNEYLADALGITVEELETAQQEARTAALADAQDNGQISADDAALLQARSELQEYLADPLQTAFETAVAQAVTDGVITQAQADQFLAEGWTAFAGRGGFGGPAMPQGAPQQGGPAQGPSGQGGPGFPGAPGQPPSGGS